MDGLVFDRETGTIGIVDLANLSAIRLAAILPGAAPFEPDGAVAPAAGPFFLVHDADLSQFASVDALDPSSPVLGGEASLEGGAAGAVPDPLGAFVLLLPRGEPGSVAIYDFASSKSPLRVLASPVDGALAGLAFSRYSDDVAIAVDSDGTGVVTFGVAAAREGGPIEAGLVSLPGGDAPVAFATFHASPTIVVAGASGTLYLVDAADPLLPVVVGAFDGRVAPETPALDVAPDDSIVSIAGPSAGSLRFFELVGPGAAMPRLAGTFELGAEIGDAGFATGGNSAAWASRRLFYVATGGSALAIADLSFDLGGAKLSPAIGYSTLRSRVLYDSKRGAVLVGLDSSGRVIRYGLYDARGPEAITSEDLGFGSATSAVFLHFRKS